jgi:hypothetical protein
MDEGLPKAKARTAGQTHDSAAAKKHHIREHALKFGTLESLKKVPDQIGRPIHDGHN